MRFPPRLVPRLSRVVREPHPRPFTERTEDLAERRRNLLELYYADKLSPELFAEEEARLSGQIQAVAMYPDHLEVTVSGARRLNVTLEEVGLTGGWQFRGVGGGTRTIRTPFILRSELTLAV